MTQTTVRFDKFLIYYLDNDVNSLLSVLITNVFFLI